jgi:hypothetical protein
LECGLTRNFEIAANVYFSRRLPSFYHGDNLAFSLYLKDKYFNAANLNSHQQCPS